MTRRYFCLALVTLAATVGRLAADDNSRVADAGPECRPGAMPAEGRCQLTLTFPATGKVIPALKPIRLPDGVQVTVRVDKRRPVHACAIEKKEEAVPTGSVVAGLLSILAPIAGLINIPIQLRPQNVPQNTDHEAFWKLVESGSGSLEIVGKQIAAKDAYFRLLSAAIGDLAKEPQDRFEARRQQLVEYLIKLDDLAPQVLTDKVPENLEKANASLQTAQLPSADAAAETVKLAAKLLEKLIPILNADEIKTALAAMDALSGAQRAAAAAIERLAEKRKALRELRTLLEGWKDAAWHQDFLLRGGDSNLKVSGTVSCKNALTGAVSLEPTPFSITFQGLPRVTFSAGFLVSALPKRTYSVQSQSASETSGLTYRIAEDASRIQTLPFSLVGIRLADWRQRGTGRDITLNFAPGLGVNPGNKELEYVLGPSVGIGPAMIFAGGHYGRRSQLDSRFSVGSAVVKEFVVPVNRTWGWGFSFGLLYRLPLK